MRRTSIIIAVFGYFVVAQAAQAGWTAAKRLTWTSGWSYNPAIAIDSSNNIHIVWQDDTTYNYEIYFKKSTDGGTTWSASKRLTENSGWSSDPAIAANSGGTIHVVWDDTTPGNTEIFYRLSSDGGATWGASKRLTWNFGASLSPAIGLGANDTVHVAWIDHTAGNPELYYRNSVDGGTTWNKVKRLTRTKYGASDPVLVTDSGGAVHIVWFEYIEGGNDEIFYVRSTDGGATWSAVKRLTWTSGWSEYPAMALGLNKTLHVIWEDDVSGNYELYYKKSTDGGASWSAAQRLTWTSGYSYYPVAVIDSNDAIHVIWSEYLSNNFEIYYKKSTDGGANWSSNQRLTWTWGWSRGPAAAVDSSDTIHIVWHDDTPTGVTEIYYKNGKSGD
jgi:BNR repeat-like domain